MKSFEREHQQVQAVLAALSGPERDALLAHLRECGECAASFSRVQDAVLAALYLPPPRPMDATRQEEARARLLARAAGDGAAPSRARRLPLAGFAGGWLVAAGLATLLLTHHSFHRPLGYGWVMAAFLGAALFGAVLYLLVERRRYRVLARRLADLEAELTRVRTHAFETV